jgi:hypothetical protein
MRWDANKIIDAKMTPLDVLDADGKVIQGPITAFDEESGEVEKYLVDDKNEYHESRVVTVTYDGKPLRYVLNKEGSEFLRVTEKHKAPLTWKKIERKKDESI